MKVCTKCQIELRPYKNGVVAVAMATFGPLELYGADEWYCPSCEWKGIFGFSSTPFASHFETDLEAELIKLQKKGRVIYRFWLNQREKSSCKCSTCDGKGWVEIPDDHPSTCVICCGTGQVQ